MKRHSIGVFGILCILAFCAYSQEEGQAKGRRLILREGKQLKHTTVVCEAYLIDDILEVAVEARIYAQRPHINSVNLIGPGIGNIRYTTREEIPLSTEEDKAYTITKLDGLIATKERKRTKKPTGTLAKELFKIKLPLEKIQKNKQYKLVVKIESKAQAMPHPQKFTFIIENFKNTLSGKEGV